MNLRWILLAPLALAACDVPPEGTSEDDLQFFEEAVASVSCTIIDSGDFAAIEFQTGLTREQIEDLMRFKLERGEMVQLASGGYRMTSGACATDA